MPDVAFLDIEMPGMTGLELALQMKKTCPNLNIIFVTGYSSYALEAIEMHSSGYIMKPATKDKIKTELDNLRSPIEPTIEKKERNIQVHCFGNFEILLDGKPVPFHRSKAKELLAYLVDRKGAGIERAELAAALWEMKTMIVRNRCS